MEKNIYPMQHLNLSLWTLANLKFIFLEFFNQDLELNSANKNFQKNSMEKTAEELKKKGNSLFRDGEYETAIRYYS